MTELFVLYQMGASEDFTWYSVIAVFLSEKDLWRYAEKKDIGAELKLVEPGTNGDVLLQEPVEFVAVRSAEGEVPDVELAENASS
jgi:hypothetical protein